MPGVIISLLLIFAFFFLRHGMELKIQRVLSFRFWDELMIPFFVRLWRSITSYLKLQRATMVAKPISLKLLVEKERNRVLFAEANKDFVDVLFSFLTLPMGTIIRLACKKSGIGCVDALYTSVESLEEQYLQTEACKTMLLNPRSAYGFHCKNLVVKIDDTEPAKYYTCSKWFCPNGGDFRLASVVKGTKCACGEAMDDEVFLGYERGIADGNEVFVKGLERFMISDDLQVSPISISNSLSLLRGLGFKDGIAVEEMNVNVGVEEVLQLLMRSMLSKTPMTDVFLLGKEKMENISPFESVQDQHQMSSNRCNSKKMTVKLLFSKSTKMVLCIEAKGDFINFLFSILTFPLGSIIKLLKGRCSSMGSIDNLYKSVENLSADNYMKSRGCKEILLSPKIANKFGCENQLLRIEEESSVQSYNYKCYACFSKNEYCFHRQYQRQVSIMNPKLPGMRRSGGGFVKDEALLLITDDLTVEPFSPVSGIHHLRKLNVPLSDLDDQVVTVGEEEALALLKASLNTKKVLTHVFNGMDAQMKAIGDLHGIWCVALHQIYPISK